MSAQTPKIIRHTSRALTPMEIAELDALALRPDDQIDFSDIPEADDQFFKNAIRGDLYRPVKQQITLRLDAGVIEWFKRRTPKGYQTEINKALLEHIAAAQSQARRKSSR